MFKRGEPVSDSNALPIKDATSGAGAWKRGEPVSDSNPLPVKESMSVTPWSSGESVSDDNPLPTIEAESSGPRVRGEPSSTVNPLPVKYVVTSVPFKTGEPVSDANPVPIKDVVAIGDLGDMYDLFIIAGQSNAEGRGDSGLSPAVAAGVGIYFDGADFVDPLDDPVGGANTGSAWPAFANQWYEATGRKSIWIEQSASSAGIQDDDLVSFAPGAPGSLLPVAVAAAETARQAIIESDDYSLGNVYVVWAQGEDEIVAVEEEELDQTSYAALLDDVIQGFADGLSQLDGFFISELGAKLAEEDEAPMAIIRAAQADVAAARADTYLVTKLAKYFTTTGEMDDFQHYDQAGLNRLGFAMANGGATQTGLVATDNTPAAFSFTDVPVASFDTVYTSNTITVSGINGHAPISVTGGEYSVDGRSFTSAAGVVENGQAVRVRVTSSADGLTAVEAVLTIGGVSDTYTVTTQALDAWDYIGQGTAVTASSGNLTLNEPAGSMEDDLLVACIAYRDSVAFTLPDGWSYVGEENTGNTVPASSTSIGSALMAYIIRGASAPDMAFLRTGGDVARGAIVAYRNTDAISFVAGTSGTSGSAVTTHNAGSITTVAANTLIVAMGSDPRNSSIRNFDAATDPAVSSGTSSSAAEPTDGTWLLRATTGTGSGAEVRLGFADAVRDSAGNTGTISMQTLLSTRGAIVAGAFQAG